MAEFSIKTNNLSEIKQEQQNTLPTERKNAKIKMKCEDCGKQFSKKTKLDQHWALEHNLQQKDLDIPDQKPNYNGNKTGYDLSERQHKKSAVLTEISNKNKTYKCSSCGREYSKKSSLRSHVHNQHKYSDKEFSCDICKKTFPTKLQIYSHIVHRHSSKTYPCKYCSKCYNQIHSLWRHMEVHFDKETIDLMRKKPPKATPQCDICGATFSLPSRLKRHIANIHNNEKRFFCDHCGKGASSKYGLISHLTVHSSAKPYSCNYCNKSFKRWTCLREHKLDHIDKNRGYIHCEICRKQVKKTYMRSHMLVHTNEKKHPCDVCHKLFKSRNSVKAHKKQCHGEWKPFECSICHERLNTAFSLKVHARVHNKDKPFQCNICSKRFGYIASLNVHKRTHVGVKPFACKICKKQFNATYTLKNHMLQHTKEQPYVCHLCGKSWRRKQTVKEHMIKHTGILLYKCKLCPMQFAGLNAMLKHKKAHSKPEICQVCGIGFDSELDLMNHMVYHIRCFKRKRQCSYCEERFNKFDMNPHVREAHRDLLLR